MTFTSIQHVIVDIIDINISHGNFQIASHQMQCRLCNRSETADANSWHTQDSPPSHKHNILQSPAAHISYRKFRVHWKPYGRSCSCDQTLMPAASHFKSSAEHSSSHVPTIHMQNLYCAIPPNAKFKLNCAKCSTPRNDLKKLLYSRLQITFVKAHQSTSDFSLDSCIRLWRSFTFTHLQSFYVHARLPTCTPAAFFPIYNLQTLNSDTQNTATQYFKLSCHTQIKCKLIMQNPTKNQNSMQVQQISPNMHTKRP